MRNACKIICLLLMIAIVATGNLFASGTNGEKATEQAQQKKLTGIVSDDLGPITGATVVVKGAAASTGTITDDNGQFTLYGVSNGATIIISFVGYHTQEIKYAGQESLTIKLVEDSKLLDEVVVTALGIKKERRALSYAMGEIKSEELRTVPTQNLGSSLYGKVAGMRISTTAGGPMGGTKIQLRGINSISGTNRPLIVMDGVPIYDDDSNWSGRERNQTQEGSALNDINPEDIESMSVLKGANAAALYGSRATNGVILITTKKGIKAKGLGIDVSTSYTTDRIAYLPEYQNEFGAGTKGYFDQNDKGQNILERTFYSFGPRMDGTKALWWDGVERPFNPQPNNYKDLFQNGFSNNNTISITNSSEKNSMRISYANNNYEGFLKNMKQERHNFNFSGTAKVSEWLSFETSITFNRTKNTNNSPRIDRVSNYPMPRSEITQLYLNHYKDANGYYMTPEMRDGVNSNIRDNIINYMLWQQNENRYTTGKDRLIGTVTTNVNIIDPLTLRLTVGTDRIRTLKEDKEMFKEYSEPTDSKAQGLYRKINQDYTKKFYEAMLLFNKPLNEKFTLSLMGAVSMEDIKESKLQWQSNGLKINGVFSPANNKFLPGLDVLNAWASRSSEMLCSVYGSGQLAYNHYLYLDITARNDWSSRLPSYSRRFFYPSVGLGFVFTDAFRLPSWLTYGKVRASYAIVGNHTPETYFANVFYKLETHDNKINTNTFDKSVPPSKIEPEKTHSWEVGTELKALNGRVKLDFTYFSSETRNQILSVAVPVSSGATSMGMNAGTIKNHGIEMQLGGTPIDTKDFTWNASLNFSYTKSMVKELKNGLSSYQIGSSWNVNFWSNTGSPVYGIYLKKWKRDADGQMIVNANGRYVQESNASYCGDAMPKYVGGLSNTLRYKNISLSALIDAQFGGKLVSFTNIYLKSSGAGKESLFGRDEEHGGIPYYINGAGNKVKLDNHNAASPDGRVYHDGIIAKGVKEDGTPNDVILSAYQYYDYHYNTTAIEDQIYDNTYIKFREFSLTYNIPSAICSKMKMQGLSISLIGSNLFYIYKSVPNVSPESVLGTKAQNAYVEYTSYPMARSFGLSVKARF